MAASAHRRATPWERWTKRACGVAVLCCTFAMHVTFGWWAVALMLLAMVVVVIWMAVDE